MRMRFRLSRWVGCSNRHQAPTPSPASAVAVWHRSGSSTVRDLSDQTQAQHQHNTINQLAPQSPRQLRLELQASALADHADDPVLLRGAQGPQARDVRG